MGRKEQETIKVQVLRGFQNHEVGSVIDLELYRFKNLEARGMVTSYEEAKELANRSIGLEKSEKKFHRRDE